MHRIIRKAIKAVVMRAAAACLVVAFAGAFACVAAAQGISDKPITFMVPFSPGTGLDVMARLVGEELSKRWNQPIVIKNVTGASGIIGTGQVARSEPDGHTILFTATSYALNAVFAKNLTYDPLNDFRAIIEIARATWSLAVTPSFPAKNAKEFVAYVRANPGKISYATPGTATPHFISMELLKHQANLDMLHVPYSGQAQAVTDVIAGHVPVMSFPTHVALPLARDNKLRMLAVFADRRVDAEPNMPTMMEEGFPVSVDVWYGFMSPTGTPDAIVAKYNHDIGEILKLPNVREALTKQSLVVTGGTPEQLDKLVRNQIVEWGKVIEGAKIQ
jgi:tripartite-type tricarboxylate transporter receptor subunit TctC